MPEYLTPGVYFETRDAAPPIRGVAMDVAGFVGLAERGPLHAPVRVESWRQFQERFGGFTLHGFLAYAVKGFFENGGRVCYVVRVAGATAAKSARVLKNKTGTEVITLTARSEGAWGDRVRFILRARPAASEFSLAVACGEGATREAHARLSLDPSHPRYFARIVNDGDELTARSQWINAEVLPGLPGGTDLLPDAAQSGLKNGVGSLSGGKDGLASLTREDFLGDIDPLADIKKGLSALERVGVVGVVCIPDIHVRPQTVPPKPPPAEEPPHDPCLPHAQPPAAPDVPAPGADEQPPAFTADDVLFVQRAMVEHCERLKDRVAILDAPRRAGGGALTLSEVQEWRSQFDSARGFGALYYPWVGVVDQLNATAGVGGVRAVPPCGHVAGVYARGDRATGVHRAPANYELFWAEDVDREVNDSEQGVLNPAGINCVRAFPGRGLRVYGARTVSSDPDWRYVNVRRLMLMIERAVDEATQWVVFEPNDFNLRQTVVMILTTFLEEVWRDGALMGATAREAFFVRCDETNNPPEVTALGRLVVDVGVAPALPAEFIIFRVGRTAAELEVVER